MTKKERIERARAAGKVRGHQERLEALSRYNASPHICQGCFNPIPVGKKRIADARKQIYCGYSCAATTNNRKRYHSGLDSVSPPA